MNLPQRYASAIVVACWFTTTGQASDSDFSDYIPRLEEIVHQEMREWGLNGVAVAVVDDQRTVYAEGFGEARRNSVFRVGSISKLFNAVAVLQQVEAGRLDLDAPLPGDLLPLNPFAGEPAPSLRHILCHRSGLQREAPVGGYLDSTEPTLAETVASVRSCVLVTRPGEKTRYSNIAPSIAGWMAADAAGEDFQEYQRKRILDPLGMTSSAWTLARVRPNLLVPAHMRVADGKGGWIRRQAPLFDLGTIPAGNLFSTAEDLARFASALLARGAGLLRPDTLEAMWEPQLTENETGFGLGFFVGEFRGRRTIGHSGAVYGHSTSFVLFPAEKFAVIVLANEDIANGRVHRISTRAIALMLEAKFGQTEKELAPSIELENSDAFVGEYESESYWAQLEIRDGQLTGDLSGQSTRFVPLGGLRFTAHSRIGDGVAVAFEKDANDSITGFTMGNQSYRRVPADRPPLPPEWRAYLGVYGPEFIPVIIRERHGRLYAMTENMVDYRLTPVNRHVCKLPPGMYVDEEVVFLTGADGRVHSIEFANMRLARHSTASP